MSPPTDTASPARPTTPPSLDEVRAEVDAWVDANWDPDLTVGEWWSRLARAGLGSPTLPPELGGRGWPLDVTREANAVLSRRGVLGPPGGIGLMLSAPTIAAHGTPEQIARFMPRILDGSDGWCQLFSEPQAGSDLAGLVTRAERDGDEWVVTGQKVWTSTGQFADWGLLVARTDPDAPKHRGLTYFALPMRQPGVDVRPLREMTGRAVFNEVFLDRARVSDADRIGDLGDGWRVANTTLTYERSGIGHSGGAGFSAALPGSVAGHLERRAGDFVGVRGSLGVGQVSNRTVQMLIDLARSTGRADDPVIRQGLARVHTYNQLGRMTVWRAKADPSGRLAVEGNLAKLRNTIAVRLARELGNELLGPHGTLWGPDSLSGGYLQELTVFSPAPPIYGGTDEVQRNVVGERGLGLPKEPGPDRDTPFRLLPRN
jgi:alkylation response protein AidB-like acyl-CoA dehydrogenase